LISSLKSFRHQSWVQKWVDTLLGVILPGVELIVGIVMVRDVGPQTWLLLNAVLSVQAVIWMWLTVILEEDDVRYELAAIGSMVPLANVAEYLAHLYMVPVFLDLVVIILINLHQLGFWKWLWPYLVFVGSWILYIPRTILHWIKEARKDLKKKKASQTP
jgi:hypothetical protein